MSAEPDLPPQGEHQPHQPARGGRAARHAARPPSRMTLASLRWQLTQAPRRRLTDPNHDPIRPALMIVIGVLWGFGQFAHDVTTGTSWYVPLRGLAALAGAFLLIAVAVTYVRRPPTVSEPSLISRIRNKRHDRQRDTDRNET